MNKEELKKEQKVEAIERLKILNKNFELLKNVVNDFEKKDLLYFSEQTSLGGILYWCTKENGYNEYVDLIKKFEEENNAIVYHAIHCYTEFGELLNLLYVSQHKSEWKMDRTDLIKGVPFAYCYNLDDEWCSEFGSISIAGRTGGIIRKY